MKKYKIGFVVNDGYYSTVITANSKNSAIKQFRDTPINKVCYPKIVAFEV